MKYTVYLIEKEISDNQTLETGLNDRQIGTTSQKTELTIIDY